MSAPLPCGQRLAPTDQPYHSVMRCCLLLFCCIFGLSAATPGEGGVAIGDAVLRPIISEKEHNANLAIESFERDHAVIRQLPFEQRRAKEQRMESSLQRLVDLATDTKSENKALYLLAYWRFSYADGKGTEPLLDRIGRNPYPGFKNPADTLRVQLYLRQGRLAEARALADRLALSVPEFAGLQTLCAFYERIGQAAPRTAGQPLGDSPADPATRPEPWLLYHFTGALDTTQREVLGNLLDELKSSDYAGVVRVVVVAEGSNPLALKGIINELPGGDRVDLLWSNPGTNGDAAAWRKAWGFPTIPASVLLGPDRHIVAVEPTIADLRVIIGKKRAPATTNSGTPRSPKGG